MNALFLTLALAAQNKPSEGKVTWVRDYDQALKSARQTGKPAFLYFRCWWGPCTALGQSALSSAELVRATSDVVPLVVDIYNDPKGVAGKYNVLKVPTLIFLRWDGETVETYSGAKDAASLSERIREIAKKHKRDLPWEESFDKAREKAKEGKLLAAVFLEQDSSMVSALLDETLKDLIAKLAFVRVSIKENADAAKKYKVTRAPTVLILDSDSNELLRLEGKKTPKELKTALDKALKKS